MSNESINKMNTEKATFVLIRASLVLLSVNGLLGFACVCKAVIG